LDGKVEAAVTDKRLLDLYEFAFRPDVLDVERFDIQAYFKRFLNFLANKACVDFIILRQWDPGTDRLNVLAVYGFSPDEVQNSTTVTAESRLMRTLASKGDVYLSDVPTDENIEKNQRNFLASKGIRKGLYVPLFYNKRLLGIVAFFQTTRDGFGEEKVKYLHDGPGKVITWVLTFIEHLARSQVQLFDQFKQSTPMLAGLMLQFHDAKHRVKDALDTLDELHDDLQPLEIPERERGFIFEELDITKGFLTKTHKFISEALKFQLDRTRIKNVESLIEKAISPLKFSYKHIRFVTHWQAGEKHCVVGIKQLLESVVFNIVQNACLAVDAAMKSNNSLEGQIDIGTCSSADGKWLEISISDNGIGMSPEVQKTVYQRGSSNWRAVKGHGFGLSLCKEIIEMAHRGEMPQPISECGKGTTFLVRLRLEKRGDQDGT